MVYVHFTLDFEGMKELKKIEWTKVSYIVSYMTSSG
jgi:hypothetical protein